VTDAGAGASPVPIVRAPRGLFNPYVHLALGVVLVTLAELLLKRGAAATAAESGHADWTGVNALASPWVWGGVVFHIAGLLCWLHVLRYVPLIIAFNLMNAVHVLVPLGSWVFLGEQLPGKRVIGIAVIIAGLVVLSKPVSTLEERL
jgi:drug/metabolite transporter (DMT)-like permease